MRPRKGAEMGLVDELAEMTSDVEAPEEDEVIVSPCRKEGTGRIRNLKAMSDDKFAGVFDDMRRFEKADPEGYAAVQAEQARREGQ